MRVARHSLRWVKSTVSPWPASNPPSSAIAPKTRANGEIFENATNAAYLEQGKGLPCPDVATLVKRLNEAEKNLSTAFPTQ